MSHINFRDFYQTTLNEQTDAYLGQKVGDIAHGVTDLQQNYQGMGMTQIKKNAEQIVNMIRRILHTHWPEEQEHTLKQLQKVGVNIMKTLKEKGDLQQILQASNGELAQALEKLGVPANQIGTPDAQQAPDGAPDGTGEPQGQQEPVQGPPEESGEQPTAAGPPPAAAPEGAAGAMPAAPAGPPGTGVETPPPVG